MSAEQQKQIALNLQRKKRQEIIDEKQRFTYHRWFLGMQCRKDILNENQFINKKQLTSATPKLKKAEEQLKSNKMRIAYFIGFCIFANLDKIYDMLILDNKHLKKAGRSLQTLFTPDSDIILAQKSQAKILSNKIHMQKLAKIFLQLDQQVDLNSRVLEQITGRNFDSEYVDIATFVGFFENEDEASLKSQILGHFPRIHLD